MANPLSFLINLFNIFGTKKNIKLGFYGPPNGGKTTLANRICKDWTGEELGEVSRIPHETREVQYKEKVDINFNNKKATFKIIDTPGIATKIDYEEILQYGLNTKEAKKRAK
ncbi:MAG: 50S ribosome-binding GTPase, partial [Candidatus Pacearchaeota archaeon]|nr:50S ribosome-binding GTPase [Candidatus Pacearchaeota archaeon]